MNTVFGTIRILAATAMFTAFTVAMITKRKRTARSADLVLIAAISFNAGVSLALMSGETR